MNELPSAEFRKVYVRLTEPTVVTVHGHVIGRWIPASASIFAGDPPAPDEDATAIRRPRVRLTSQTQRDDLLRKINRGK